MTTDRRTFLGILGLAAPFAPRAVATVAGVLLPTSLRFRTFEDGVREVFPTLPDGQRTTHDLAPRRVEVGCSEAVRVGLQGCVNRQPFAGHPAGALRITRTSCEPGPEVGGVWLLVTWVDVTLAPSHQSFAGRPLDFATLPPAAGLVHVQFPRLPRREHGRPRPVRLRVRHP